MIKMMLPGLYERFYINKSIIELYEDKPEVFRKDISFGACYGTFQHCIWDGGRTFNGYQQATYEQICYIRDYLNNKKIPLRLIYTNPIVEQKHLDNRFCNLVTEICENDLNEIVINNGILEDYLRQNYPKYKFISSTTKCKTLEESLDEVRSGKYHMVCLDYNTNKNTKILYSLGEEDKKKIEFLCNAICPPGCPNRKEHYRLNGIEHLMFGQQYSIDCKIKGSTLALSTCNSHNNLSPDEILEYSKNGFENFKLEGRTLQGLEIILNYVRYMIKPEYVFETTLELYQRAQDNVILLKNEINWNIFE